MAKLQAAVDLLDDPGFVPPAPDIFDMGVRLRKVYAEARASDYRTLSRSEIRKLPFAYWVNSDAALPSIEPELVSDYWGKHLPAALRASPRKAKRWLTPLLHIYCVHFSKTDLFFNDFAAKLVSFLPASHGRFAKKLVDLHAAHGFFDPAAGPNKLANYFFLSMGQSLGAQQAALQLWPTFFGSKFGRSIFAAALSFDGQKLRSEQTAFKLLDWAKLEPAHVAKSDLRIQFADSLLSHWVGHRPPEYLKNRLVDFFIYQEGYGDPRFSTNRHYQWDGVSQQAKDVILNWLTGDTLRGFMKLLQRTADDIWQYRQKFWMAYYERGHIDEAWMVLGDSAKLAAKTLQMDQKGMGFGYLDGGAASNQSVLLLKIGGLVFTEWSHNGSLRAYVEGNPNTPSLYQRTYHGANLRAAASLDFHNDANMNPELRHMNSIGGTWQRKARDFIRKRTNVHLSDAEIL